MEDKDIKNSELYNVLFKDYPDIVNSRQLCKMLDLNLKTVYGLLSSGVIKHFIVGSVYRIPKIYVIEYLIGTEKSVA